MSGPGRMLHVGDSGPAQVRVERRLRRQDGTGEKPQRDDQQQERGQVLVPGTEQRHHLHDRAQEEGEETDGAARHAFGDDPPAANETQGQPDETDDEEDAVAHQEHHQDERQCQTRSERQDRPPACCPGRSSEWLACRVHLQQPCPSPLSPRAL
jgi:hypothetical protein